MARTQALVIMGDAYSRITSGPASCYTTAKLACRARPEGYQFMPRFKSGMWDGYISLMKGKGQVPTGLLPIVAAAWQDKGIDAAYSFQTVRTIEADPESVHAGMLSGVTLRDYQIQAMLEFIEHGRGIIKMATGAGKTVILAGLIKLYGCPASLFVVHNKDLLYQTADRLECLLDQPVGRLGDSRREYCTGGTTVATIQTLHSFYKKYQTSFGQVTRSNRLLIVDECHHIADNKQFDVLMSIPGWHRIGASASPLSRGKLNDLKLMACTGQVHVDLPALELIELGWAAKPIIHMHSIPEPLIDVWDAEYQSSYDMCIVENEMRNSLIEELVRAEIKAGHSVLIIVTRIAHGQYLAGSLGLFVRDCPVMFVNGSSSMDERMRALTLLDAQPCAVIATPIFDEGVDVPGLDSIILAAGGSSQIKLIQRIGRGLRPKPGRNEVHIHDFLDASNKYLLNHSEARLDTYEQEGFDVIFTEGYA